MATLANVVHEMIHSERGSAAAVAARMGVPYHTLTKWALDCNGDEKPHPIPALMVPPLTLATGSRAAVEWIASAVSCAVIQLPAGAPGTRDLARQVCAAVKEFGETAHAAGVALADGQITRREAERLDREANEAIREIVALVAAVKAAAR